MKLGKEPHRNSFIYPFKCTTDGLPGRDVFPAENACPYPIHRYRAKGTLLNLKNTLVYFVFQREPVTFSIFDRDFLPADTALSPAKCRQPKRLYSSPCVNHFSEHTRHRTDAGIGKQMHHLAVFLGKIFNHQARTVTVAVDGTNNDVGTLQ